MASRLARAYFALQALAVTAWWLALWLQPQWRALFVPRSSPESVLLGFAPGDLLILGLSSAVVASLGLTLANQRRALAWLVAGATIYGALYTVTLALAGAASVIGAALMVPAAIGCTLSAFVFDNVVSTVPTGGSR